MAIGRAKAPGLTALRSAGGLALTALLAGCTGSKIDLKQLLSLPLPAELEAGSAPSGPHEAAVLVPGTPTGVFAQVARGALGCWFAPDGPLKASHVYRAEAEPPAKGGDAEIAIYERVASPSPSRDARGPLVYRIAFAADGYGVRASSVAYKLDREAARAMAKDVESWAKGGEACELRGILPPAPEMAAKPAKAASSASASRKR